MPQTQSAVTGGNDDDIEIRVIQDKDRQRVWDFLGKYFFPYEPLTQGVEPKGETMFGEEFILSNIQYGTCLMAVIKDTDELVALTIAGPKGPDEYDILVEESAKEGNTKWGKMLKFLSIVEKHSDVCKRYNVQKVLYIIATCVDEKMRGKNLGARLYTAVGELGKQKGFQLLTSDCTSFYSARIKDQLGWECVNAIYYKDYVDENKQQIFRPDPPHECCKTFAVRL